MLSERELVRTLWVLRYFTEVFSSLCIVLFCRFLVRVSYLEIYNEEVRDLLGKDQNQRLEVCTHKALFS